jgi:NADH-quinone oxidoreductase subunit L
MGGLAKRMKLTFVTFTLGVLAIIGFPMLSGFFSKDAILLLAFEKNTVVFGLLAFTAVLTSFYMIRMWKLVFLGQPRSDEADHAHEGGLTMTLPLIVLAVLTVVGGLSFILDNHAFSAIFQQVPDGHNHHHAHNVVFATSIGVMLLGSLAAYFFYKPAPVDTLAMKSPGAFGGLSFLKSLPDDLYNYYVAKIQQRFALTVNFLEQIFLAGLLVRGLAGVVGLFGMGARALHVGSLHAYVYWFLFGTALVWGFASGIF